MYYIVKCTSDSCNLQYYSKIGKYIINTDELVYDTVYLNPLDNFKQWYTPYEKISSTNIFKVEYCYFN